MATGILSIGLADRGWAVASLVLMWITAGAFVVLWILLILRAILHPDACIRDLHDPRRAFGHFTVVTGGDVLAVRLIDAGFIAPAFVLLTITVLLWSVFGYLLPWRVFLAHSDRPVLSRVNGSWFVWAVASQSLSIALTQVQPYLPVGQDWAAMLALVSWAVGLALYAATAFLLLLRVVHFGLTPRDAEPSLWVAMGAVAIAVVAGVGIGDLQNTPAVEAARSVIAGTVVILWGYCLWLIPLLTAMGIWRHVRHRIPLRYEPGLWSMVFPLGMIAVASTRIGELYAFPAAHEIGTGLLLVAFFAWALVLIGLLVHLLTGLKRRTERAQ